MGARLLRLQAGFFLSLWTLCPWWAHAGQCVRAPVALDSVWLPSAAWGTEGDLLLVADVAGSRLLRFDAAGDYLGEVSRHGSEPTSFTKPVWLQATPGGFLLQDRVFRWLLLDPRGFPSREVAPGDPLKLNLTASVLIAGELHGLGTTTEGGRDPELRFLRVSLEPLSVKQAGEVISSTSQELDFHFLLGRTIAEAGGKPFALRFTAPPRLEEVWAGRALKSFPQGFSALPALPRLAGPGEAQQRRYQSLETARMPVALLGQGGALFVLTREPESGGRTRWLIHQVDPGTDRLVATRRLPSSASHILVVPGPRQWAILEQSSLAPMGYNALEGIVLIPTVWLTASDSPLAGLEAEPRCPVPLPARPPRGSSSRGLPP